MIDSSGGQQNDAAKDLWAQVFERRAADPYAAVVNENHDSAADEAAMREGLIAAGWNSSEVERLAELSKLREQEAPNTSPGVNRHVEAQHAFLCDDIEAAMDRLGMASHAKVARGIEPRTGPYAAKVGVILTDESIITVGSFLFRYCGLVARAFARTLRLDPWLWERGDYDLGRGIELLRSAPELILYWMKIFFSFAMTGTHIGVPYKPSTKEEVLLMEQIARAMEIFAIAHEYGHHHLAHGRDIQADPHQEEFEADQFALRVSDETDSRPIIVSNPYLTSGAGGVILLRSLAILNEMEVICGAPKLNADTHPPVDERVARFDSVRLLNPEEFKRLKGFRTASDRIMQLVREVVVPTLQDQDPKQLSDIRVLRERMQG